jgi:hypothetical protein
MPAKRKRRRKFTYTKKNELHYKRFANHKKETQTTNLDLIVQNH